MKYIEDLVARCKVALEAKPCRDFVMEKPSDIEGITAAIYVIEEIGGIPEQTFLEFSRYKQSKQRACARLNAPSQVLYVGSSTTSLKKRISEHLGKGHASTYALHLNHWFKGTKQIRVMVYEHPIDVIQIIEDAWSHQLKPAFGKQGGNSK